MNPEVALLNTPQMNCLVDGVLPEAELGCIYGPPGVGKSFFCLDIAAKVALGLIESKEAA